jgi:hypothetical protein
VDWIVGCNCHCGIVECLCLIIGLVVCVLGNEEGYPCICTQCVLVFGPKNQRMHRGRDDLHFVGVETIVDFRQEQYRASSRVRVAVKEPSKHFLCMHR